MLMMDRRCSKGGDARFQPKTVERPRNLGRVRSWRWSSWDMSQCRAQVLRASEVITVALGSGSGETFFLGLDEVERGL